WRALSQLRVAPENPVCRVELMVDFCIVPSKIIPAEARHRQILVRPGRRKNAGHVRRLPWMQVDQVAGDWIESRLRNLVFRERITNICSGSVLTCGSGIVNRKTAPSEAEISVEHRLARHCAGDRFVNLAIVALHAEEEKRVVLSVVDFRQINWAADRARRLVI